MDLDGDGRMDLISGSWPGELFYFRGGPNHTFAPPIKLKDKFGKTINVGGGIRKDAGDYLLVAGDATFEQTDKGTVIVYEGERIEVPEGKQAGITGTASAVHAVDWDGDGVLDLLVGDIGGNVYLIPNEGTRTEFSFGKHRPLLAGGKPLHVAGDAGPFVCDWDGDGKIDLLVGAGDGSVMFFRNVGSSKEPELAAGQYLVLPSDTKYGPDTPSEPRRGSRAKVCAVDWNGDGRLDLLVGDYTTQKPAPKELTVEEKAEQTKLRAELDSIQPRYRELIDKLYGPSKGKDKENSKELRNEFKELAERMRNLQAKLPQESESHGWVWLYLRQSADAAANAP